MAAARTALLVALVALPGCLASIGTFKPGGPGHFVVRAHSDAYGPGETVLADVVFVNDGEKPVGAPLMDEYEYYVVAADGTQLLHEWRTNEYAWDHESPDVRPRDEQVVDRLRIRLPEDAPPGTGLVKITWHDLWGEGKLEIVAW